MNRNKLLIVLLFLIKGILAQTGINTTDPQSTLDVNGNVVLSTTDDVTSKTSLVYKDYYKQYSYDRLLSSSTVSITAKEYDRVLLTSSSTTNTSALSYIPLNKFLDYRGVDTSLKFKQTSTKIKGKSRDENNAMLASNTLTQFKYVEFRVQKTYAGSDGFEFQWRPRSGNEWITDAEYRQILCKYGMSVFATCNTIAFDQAAIGSSTPHLAKYVNKDWPYQNKDDWYPLLQDDMGGDWHLGLINGFGDMRFSVMGMTLDNNPREQFFTFYFAHTDGDDILTYTVSELVAPDEVEFDNSHSDDLWISGLFSGIYGRQNNPKGFEIYINNPGLKWEDAKFYEFRIADQKKQFLFRSKEQFDKMKNFINDPKNRQPGFMYFWDQTGDRNPGSGEGGAFDYLFDNTPSVTLNSDRDGIFNTSPYGSSEGTFSLILYYKGLVVDAYGDGMGKTAPDRWQGWAKRKPGTRPVPLNLDKLKFGLYKAEDWVVVKGGFQPDDPSPREAKRNTAVDYPFPLGTNSSTVLRPSSFSGVPSTTEGYTP